MLITPDDIRKHRPIAGNLDDQRRLLMYINEAETLEIIPAIGATLYRDCNENPTAHAELLNGGYYDNNTRYFAGLKAAVCLLAYARFAPNNSIHVTPSGVKEKTAQSSEPANDHTLARQTNEARNTGIAYLQQVVNYLSFTRYPHSNPATLSKHKKFKSIGN